MANIAKLRASMGEITIEQSITPDRQDFQVSSLTGLVVRLVNLNTLQVRVCTYGDTETINTAFPNIARAEFGIVDYALNSSAFNLSQ